MKNLLSKFFRVALEGATTDGREITREWIEQMSASYDRTKYGARIWLEHFRGILPDSPFAALGDVYALESRVEPDGKLGLYAQIVPTAGLVAMNQAKQKIYTSIEVDDNFAESGQAYLVGLGVTDSPASLGTEALQFSAAAKAPIFAERKQKPTNLFSSAVEIALEFDEVSDPEPSIFTKVKNLLSAQSSDHAERFGAIEKSVAAIAEAHASTSEKNASFAAAVAELQKQVKASADQYSELLSNFNSLKAALENTPANHAQRPPITGGDGHVRAEY
ncbi:MAG: GPO family capsid scaffolding protein [Gammaproteobacteria bacterium]|nr:GPO family capsid scaffolding protein [Gammaproteobacteria bacterium]